MLLIISPAKSLDLTPFEGEASFTQPDLIKDSKQLVRILKKINEDELGELMHISEKLSALNHARYQSFKAPFTAENSKQALAMFKGDVYQAFDLNQYSEEDFEFAQKHLRILSGLYGVLRPLDLMQAYRLEMGTKLENKKGKNLYEFWGNRITSLLNKTMKEHGQTTLVNLASNEYFKSVNPKILKSRILKVDFKEDRDGKLKIIAFLAKKARGMMCDFVIQNRIIQVEDLKHFRQGGYAFSAENSSEDQWVFVR